MGSWRYGYQKARRYNLTMAMATPPHGHGHIERRSCHSAHNAHTHARKYHQLFTIKSSKMEKIEVKIEKKGLDLEINKEEFALALKTWRLRQGLTQREVGERWGCSRFTIMRAESAKNVTWEMAYRLFAKLSTELRKEAENG